jgi:hypothetical protein
MRFGWLLPGAVNPRLERHKPGQDDIDGASMEAKAPH